MDALEIYLNEVERQLDRKVKVIRCDRGGEYYRKHPGPFAKLIQKRDICVSKRRNRT